MNTALGFAYVFGTEYTRRRKYIFRNQSGKKADVLSHCWYFSKELLEMCVNASLKLNTTWLFFIMCKSILDVLACYYLVSLSFAEGMGFYTSLAIVSLTLSPLYLVQTAFVVGGAYERDVATGLACSFYHGYLEVTAGFLNDCISTSRYKEELCKVPKRFILIPRNGTLIDSLQNIDSRITFVENTSSLRKDVGGVKKRSYYQSVYKFTPRDSEFEEFYCIVEQSASLRPIKDIVARRGPSRNAVEQTVTNFYEELCDLVKYNDATRDTFEIILFSGREEDVVDAVVSRRNAVLSKLKGF